MSLHPDRGIDTGRSTATAPYNVEDLYGFLHGHWRFERKVHDTKLDQQGECVGEAHFNGENKGEVDALAYREEGDLKIGGIEISTQRDYRFAFPAPSMAEVRFADGRLFHLLDLTKGIVRVEHQCGDDTYHGLFRVLSDNSWLSVWRVLGPRKSQVITTRYLRP